MKQAQMTINMLRMELKSKFPEREALIDGLLVSLINRSHVLMVGPPGSGKTLLATELAKACGVSFFEKQLSNFSEPRHLWGGLDIKKYMETGVSENMITGMLPEAEVAFLDEVGRGSKSILDELLVLMSDRKYKHGNAVLETPLMSLMGASNTFFDDGLEALFDRFLLRYMVPWVKDGNTKRKLRRSRKAPKVQTKLSKQLLLELQDAVEHVEIPESLEDSIDEIMLELKQQGLEYSDRRWMWVENAIAAHAVLEGRDKADDSDLEILKHCLWNAENEISIVANVVKKYANTELAEAEKMYDETMTDWDDIKSTHSGIKKIPDAILDRFHKDIRNKGKAMKERDTGKLSFVRNKLRKVYVAVNNEKARRMKEDSVLFE
jgi:MoxR-like ATPase